MSMEGPITPAKTGEAAIDRINQNKLLIVWDYIPWEKVENHVNKLQLRIVKALKKGKLHLVRRLQYLISNSFAAKLLAVRKVTTNKGKKTPGIDGKTWNTPRQKLEAAKSLTSKKYKASPLRRVYIKKKGKNKKRPLGIPTIYDRAMQALYTLTLDPISETMADKRSYGFRKHRSTKDAGSQIFNVLSKKSSPNWILEGDIKSCFDIICHKWLLENIPLNKRILKEFLKSGYRYQGKLFPTRKGSPQGGIISPTIANMTLDGIERLLHQKYWTLHKTGTININYNKSKVHFVRYADDFIVTANSKEILEEIKEELKGFLKTRGLELSDEKTKITHIDKGFDFLGWNFRKYNGKLLIKPSKSSIKSIRSRLKEAVKKHRARTQNELIQILNPKIGGWCNYNKHVVAKKIFAAMDHYIWQILWHWARRRHPLKSRKWIKKKYWIRIEARDWIFATEEKQLILASNIKIQRHIPIRMNTNPYTKEDKEYLLRRDKKRSHRKK